VPSLLLLVCSGHQGLRDPAAGSRGATADDDGRGLRSAAAGVGGSLPACEGDGGRRAPGTSKGRAAAVWSRRREAALGGSSARAAAGGGTGGGATETEESHDTRDGVGVKQDRLNSSLPWCLH
jgi:hypothetical protein